jgi:hypothetical protein
VKPSEGTPSHERPFDVSSCGDGGNTSWNSRGNGVTPKPVLIVAQSKLATSRSSVTLNNVTTVQLVDHTFSADKHTFFETVRRPRLMAVEALALLGERNSLRAVARLTHHSPNRILHWLDLAGQHTAAVSAALIRNLHLTQVQIDELWTFVKKNKRTANLMIPRMSAICGYGVPWRCPAACAS